MTQDQKSQELELGSFKTALSDRPETSPLFKPLGRHWAEFPPIDLNPLQLLCLGTRIYLDLTIGQLPRVTSGSRLDAAPQP